MSRAPSSRHTTGLPCPTSGLTNIFSYFFHVSAMPGNLGAGYSRPRITYCSLSHSLSSPLVHCPFLGQPLLAYL